MKKEKTEVECPGLEKNTIYILQGQKLDKGKKNKSCLKIITKPHSRLFPKQWFIIGDEKWRALSTSA